MVIFGKRRILALNGQSRGSVVRSFDEAAGWVIQQISQNSFTSRWLITRNAKSNSVSQLRRSFSESVGSASIDLTAETSADSPAKKKPMYGFRAQVEQ